MRAAILLKPKQKSRKRSETVGFSVKNKDFDNDGERKLPQDVKKISLPTKNAKIQRKNRETADDPVVSRILCQAALQPLQARASL